MRSSLKALSSRVTMLSCGLTLFAAACGGGSGGSIDAGRQDGPRTDGGAGAGGAAIDGGQDGARADAGAGGASMDAGAGGRIDASTDSGAGGVAMDGGSGGATTDGGGGGGGASIDAGAGGTTADGGTGGSPLSLPWHAFLPLGMAAPGSGPATGTSLDLTANHYDATYFGTTISFTNAAMNLAAAGSELVVVSPRGGVPAVDVTGSYSVSVWVTLANVAGYRTVVAGEGVNVASFFLQKRADTGAWAFTALESDSTTAGGCIAPDDPTDGGPVQTPIVAVAGVQYHLVATRDATDNLHVLYVNGVESGRNTCIAGWADTGILGIGHGIFAGSRGDYVQGSIAEVGLINRALTAAEVADLFARGRAGSGGHDAGTDTPAVDAGTDAPATDAPNDMAATGG